MLDFLFFLSVFFVFYFVKWRLYLNVFDPLQFSAVSEAIIFFTVYNLESPYREYNFVMLGVVSFYLACWFLLSVFFRDLYFNAISRTCKRLDEFSLHSGRRLFFVVFIVCGLLFVFSIWLGLAGDSRLALTKFLRPLEGIWVVGFQISILVTLLHYDRISRLRLFLVLLILFCLVLVLGKGFILNMFLPISVFLFFRKKKIGVLNSLLWYLVALGFAVFGFVFSNGISIASVASSLLHRLLNDSDVYFLGFSPGVVEGLELSSFFVYVFGPFFKVLGLGGLVDYSVGAQIGSFHAGKLVLTGPNAQLPYLAVVYFPLNAAHALVASTALLSFWFIIKVFLLKFSFKGFGVIGNSFLVFYALVFPQTSLKDPTFTASFFIVCLIGVFIIRISLSLFQLVFRRWHV